MNKIQIGMRTCPLKEGGEIKTSPIWIVLAAILMVFVFFSFASKQVRNDVCSRIVEKEGTQKDRLVFILEDLCGPSKSSDKIAGG